MKNKFNLVKSQQGITLVELLATLVLVSIIGALTYSVLFQGYANYQRIQAETELRDEADLIMANMIRDMFSAKKSEISLVNSCNSDGYTDSLLTLNKQGSPAHKIHFTKVSASQKNGVMLRNGLAVNSNNNVSLIRYPCNSGTPLAALPSNIKDVDTVSYNIKFKLMVLKNKQEYEMEFENTVQVIND